MNFLKILFIIYAQTCLAWQVTKKGPNDRINRKNYSILNNQITSRFDSSLGRDDLIRSAKLLSYEMLQLEWRSFKEKHNKTYQNDYEDLKRMHNFVENSKLIAEHNDLYNKGIVTYSLGMNHFGDLTEEEREGLLLSKNQPDVDYDQTYLELPPGFKAPAEIDWRKLGGVTTVKNQGDCLSCWAIAAAGALEAQYFRRHKELVELSVQNLVDCSTDYGNSCTGGRAGAAFKYIELNGGIDTEASYPYEGYENKCRYEPKYSKASCKGFMTIPANETILQSSVYIYGPISVSLDAAGYRFHFYKQGIYYNPSCKKEYHELNHAGLVVGYGAYTNMGDYWIMKNSWGADWGDHGYIKIARNRGNNCGITTDAVLPFLKDVPIPPGKK